MTEPVRPTMTPAEVFSLLAPNIDEETARSFGDDVLQYGSGWLRMDSSGKVTHVPLEAISWRPGPQEGE
jgi:hypothetical protein